MRKLILLSFIFLFTFCGNQPDWYPSGNIAVESYRLYETLGTKNCIVYYRISNTGFSEISQSTVSFRINTTGGNYYYTTINQTKILPETMIFDSFVLSFITNTDTLTNANQIVISGYFFE